MSREREKQVVHKGIYINNERRKKDGGRIRCDEMENKIEIYGKNCSIHESEVDWIEIRRYKKGDRGKRGDRKPPAKSNAKIEEKPAIKEQIKKDSKYKEKKQEKQQAVKKEVYKEKEPVKAEKKEIESVQSSKPKKYKLKQDPSKVKVEQKSEDLLDEDIDDLKPLSPATEFKPKQESNEETSAEPISTIVQKKEITQAQPNRDTEDRKEQDNVEGSQSEAEEDEEKKDLEIIVGRIVKETKIIFKTRPFVGILNFVKKPSRAKDKTKPTIKQGPLDDIFQDFYADIVPIHLRLPVMELDYIVDDNKNILNDYALDVLKFDKTAKKTKELNRILDLLSDVYILITFNDWDGDRPLARLHKIIGKAMTIDGQCSRFLYEHTLNDFHYVEKIEKGIVKINPTPLHRKLDRMVFTIDPPTSTDLDDALSIESLGNNLFEVGIHIADVSSFLNNIDRDEIVKRTTSVYLPNKVYHMLPAGLVGVCSLDPGVERLAFTVWVTIDIDGNIIGEGKLQKNIIKSRFKLSYEIVQNLITSKLDYEGFNAKYPCSAKEFEDLLEKLLNLTTIATGHRNQRISFDVFENREMTFEMDADRWPIECYVEKRYTAKKVVEEFMIIGNIESARQLVKADPTSALIIHHPKPSRLSSTSFNTAFEEILKTKIKFDNVRDVEKQLLEIDANESIKPEVKELTYFKARRAMEPAIYKLYSQAIEEEKKDKKDIEEFPIVHFALGLRFYTHFTSPMRRMADILVHETLGQILIGDKPKALQPEQIEKINFGRRYTKRLKKDLNQVYLCLMIHHTKKCIETEGIISSYGMDSVSIFIPLYDMQKEVMWKQQFDVYSVKRIPGKDDKMDVKIYHDRKTAKGDVYWVMSRFQKVKLRLGCTKYPPLRLTVQMEVQSEKGPYSITWIDK